jgi:hypothetical protein
VLWDLVEHRPTTLSELASVPGIGADKLRRHGLEILEALLDPSARHLRAVRRYTGKGAPLSDRTRRRRRAAAMTRGNTPKTGAKLPLVTDQPFRRRDEHSDVLRHHRRSSWTASTRRKARTAPLGQRQRPQGGSPSVFYNREPLHPMPR